MRPGVSEFCIHALRTKNSQGSVSTKSVTLAKLVIICNGLHLHGSSRAHTYDILTTLHTCWGWMSNGPSASLSIRSKHFLKKVRGSYISAANSDPDSCKLAQYAACKMQCICTPPQPRASKLRVELHLSALLHYAFTSELRGRCNVPGLERGLPALRPARHSRFSRHPSI